MKNRRDYIALAIVCAILGLLLSTSFYVHRRAQQTSPESRRVELISVVKDLEQERDGLKDDLKKLRKEIEDYEKEAAADEGVLASFTRELNNLSFAAGLTPVRGPGLEVVLGDSPTVPSGKDPSNYIIHDYDLRVIVNALWGAGAEAIAVNEQRLVGVSALRCVGNTILANSTRLASPYRIRAIGDPDALYQALREDEGALQLIDGYAKFFGLVVDIKKSSELKLPSYQGSLRIEHAKAVRKGGS